MSEPTTSLLFSNSTPAAPTGDQICTPQTDDGVPFQKFDFIPKRATSTLYGTVLAGEVVTPNEIQQESYVYAADTGSANAYEVDLSPAPTIVAGSEIVFLAAHANTGASTLAVNGGAAVAITKNGSTALTGSEIQTGQIVQVVYDGTQFQLVGSSAGGGTYFGQGYATASSGNNIITLGSTPLAGSLSIFVAGSILLPSAYSISGTAVSLTSPLSSGQAVMANWATSNPTPGGIALSSSISPPAGMTVWFKADALTAGDGQTIATWLDSSGNGNDGTGSAGVYHTNQINGLPAVTFNPGGTGDAYTLSSPIADTGGHTAFVVLRNTSTTTKQAICGGAASSFQYWTCGGTGDKQQGADSTFAVQLGAGTAAADTSWHQQNVVMNNASAPGGFSVSFRLAEGVDANSALSSASPSTSITLFGADDVAGDALTAQVAEFIYYNSTLTLSQIEAIEAYLNNKYGI